MTQRRIYQEEFPYFITFRTIEGYPLFEKTKYAVLLAYVLFRSCAMKGYVLHAYCIMPDHVHLLAGHQPNQAQAAVPAIGPTNINQPIAPTAGCAGFNVSQLMHAIKSYFVTAMRHKFKFNDPIWQKRFNTRVVNTDEYLATIIDYIKNNPTKENLPKKFRQRPYQYLSCFLAKIWVEFNYNY